MVEKITDENFRSHLDRLKSEGLLGDKLSNELSKIADEMDGFSNWLDARKYLIDSGAEQLSGSGPISKFVRTLTYTLERISEHSKSLAEAGGKVHRIHLSDTSSGCSDFRGNVQVFALNRDQVEVPVWEGGFLWDCAEHGMPQPEAAQTLGYRCMVRFPEFSPAASPAG